MPLLKDTDAPRCVVSLANLSARSELIASPPDRVHMETAAGRGYRFLEGRDGRVLLPETAGLVVGRDSELLKLEDCLRRASNGERRLVMISGEPGIGKTTLLERFLKPIARQSSHLLLATPSPACACISWWTRSGSRRFQCTIEASPKASITNVTRRSTSRVNAALSSLRDIAASWAPSTQSTASVRPAPTKTLDQGKGGVARSRA